jgi:Uma2 family endonuclease
MAVPKPVEFEKYSWEDYLSWPDKERWELINGVAYNMSPAPKTNHQRISMQLSVKIGGFLSGKSCSVFAAPFDVKLSDDTDDKEDNTTVVQPDLLVCCDEDKLTDQGMNGAPDICVEILSPATALKDESEKLKLYEKHGVKEYIIINPVAEYVMIYRLDGNKYSKPEYLKDDDVLESTVLKGLKISLPELFKK